MRELDFVHEAANLTEVARNLRVAALEAVVPTPLPGLVSTRALVMTCAETSVITSLQPDALCAQCCKPVPCLHPCLHPATHCNRRFAEGFKITDSDAMCVHSVDREALVARLVHIYGQQLFVDGFFNADPHAGNLMVQVRDGTALPVLLDFGMTVRLSHRQRLGYARLAHAAHQLDAAAVQRAVRSLGLVNSQSEELPGRDLEFWRSRPNPNPNPNPNPHPNANLNPNP